MYRSSILIEAFFARHTTQCPADCATQCDCVCWSDERALSSEVCGLMWHVLVLSLPQSESPLAPHADSKGLLLGTQGDGEHPGAALRRRTVGKKFRTTRSARKNLDPPLQYTPTPRPSVHTSHP